MSDEKRDESTINPIVDTRKGESISGEIKALLARNAIALRSSPTVAISYDISCRFPVYLTIPKLITASHRFFSWNMAFTSAAAKADGELIERAWARNRARRAVKL
ncbi:hypothetical protein V5O48_016470 [Marasmius crinis-equi]|uniref:Uncharacterized protein n=1 Tax=Marasmius crinis-equi TaxID=585013 RepID=A0ABR3ERP7_9AGAR